MDEARKANLEKKESGQASGSDAQPLADAVAELTTGDQEAEEGDQQEGEEEDADAEDDVILDAD